MIWKKLLKFFVDFMCSLEILWFLAHVRYAKSRSIGSKGSNRKTRRHVIFVFKYMNDSVVYIQRNKTFVKWCRIGIESLKKHSCLCLQCSYKWTKISFKWYLHLYISLSSLVWLLSNYFCWFRYLLHQCWHIVNKKWY